MFCRGLWYRDVESGGRGMTRIGKGKVCRTVGELKDALKGFPDYIRFGGRDECVTVETWRITKKDDEMSYGDERCAAEDEGRKPDYRFVTVVEGDEGE